MNLDDEELEATRILNGSINRCQIKEYIKKNYISKQKVKDKKREIKKTGQYLYTNINVCNILEELLENK